MASNKEELQAANQLLAEFDKHLISIGKNAEASFSKIGDPKTLKAIKATESALGELDGATEELIKRKEQSLKIEAAEIKLKKSKLDLQIKEEKELERQIKLEEKEAKVKKKGAKLTDEEIKEKIKLQKINARRKKDLEAELILEQKSINTRNELKDTLKALRIEADKLDLGSEELKIANEEIDRLTDSLSDNSDQFIKNKINIGNYKSATEDLNNSFEDQQKRLKILTDTYKDAVAQGDKNTKEAKELRKELKKQKKAIDDVEEATSKAAKTSKKFGTATKALGIGAVIFILSKLADLFGSSREATLESEKQMAVFTETIKTFFAALVNSWDGFVVILVALKESAQSFFISFEKGWLNLMISIEEGKGIFTDTTKEVGELQSQLNKLTKEQKELADSTNTVAIGYGSITAAFSKNTETTKKAIDFQQKYLQLQLDTKIQIEAQTRALGGLQEKRQILQDISDDDTLGFETRALAVKKAQEAAVEFADKDIALAKLKETLTIQAIKGELLRAKVLSDSALNEIKTGEQLNAVLRNRQIALKISDETESAFTEAFVERKDKEVESLSFARDQEEKNRKTFRDSYEQRLDIIEEFGELQFAKNEEILNNDKTSQEERSKVFAKNQKLSADLFNQSIELTLEQSKKSIDLNKDLSESEKDIAKAKLDNIDLNAIINAQSEQQRFELIRALDLGEIEEKRLKETFKIRFDQNNALIAQQDILNESNRTALELQRDISLQEIALQETTEEKLKELDDSRNDQEKQNLEERIELLKEGSIERLNLEKELNDLLLQEQDDLIQAQKLKDEEALAEKKKLTDATFKILEDGLKRRSDARLKELSDELSASEGQRSKLEDLAAKGDENAIKSLQAAQIQEAAIRKEQAKEVAAQKRNELILAGIKAYTANGDVPKTLGDLALLIAGLNDLPIPGFWDGADTVGDTLGAPQLSGKDGHIVRVDGKEQVHSVKDRKELANPKTGKFRTRDELKNIVNLHDKGISFNHEILPKYEIKNERFSDNQAVIEMGNKLEKAIKDLPKNMPTQKAMFDEFMNAMRYSQKQGNKTTEINYLFGD